MTTQPYAKLRKLSVQDGEPIEAILQRAVTQLNGLNEKAVVELRLIPSSGAGPCQRYSARLSSAGAVVLAQSPPKPTLVVITTSETLRRITDGSYSPIQAFVDGELKAHGSFDVARRMINHLSPDVAVKPCLYNESYSAANETITLSGALFTPGGTVEIVYNLGSETLPPQIVVANASGEFTVSQIGIFCGDIPGHPGVGVIVTATDLSTGLYTTQNYATPC